MTITSNTQDLMVTEKEREPGCAEREQWERGEVFVNRDRVRPNEFPRLWNMSAGSQMRAIVRPVDPQQPEYVSIALPYPNLRDDDENLKRALAAHKWNSLREAAQFGRRFFDEQNDLTPDLARVASRGEINLILVPRTRSRDRSWNSCPEQL